MKNNNHKNKNNKKDACSCGCGCATCDAGCSCTADGCKCDCGYGWWGKKHWVIRLILWIAILSFVFSTGVAVGKFKAYFSNYKTLLRYGDSYGSMMMWDENGNLYMMRRFESPMMQQWNELPPATDGVE